MGIFLKIFDASIVQHCWLCLICEKLECTIMCQNWTVLIKGNKTTARKFVWKTFQRIKWRNSLFERSEFYCIRKSTRQDVWKETLGFPWIGNDRIGCFWTHAVCLCIQLICSFMNSYSRLATGYPLDWLKITFHFIKIASCICGDLFHFWNPLISWKKNFNICISFQVFFEFIFTDLFLKNKS